MQQQKNTALRWRYRKKKIITNKSFLIVNHGLDMHIIQ